jgi:hypothetical protein
MTARRTVLTPLGRAIVFVLSAALSVPFWLGVKWLLQTLGPFGCGR